MSFLRRIALELALVDALAVLFCLAAGAAACAIAHESSAVAFSLAAIGERERSDGSWEGADLLRDSTPGIDRFQLTLTPDDEVRLLVESQSPDGSWERLYLGTLEAHRDYALPAPHTFFGVQGDARVRLTVSRGKSQTPVPALAGELHQGPPLPLSDRAPFRASRVRFSAASAAAVELSLHGRPTGR
jgi:hypothetical protein